MTKVAVRHLDANEASVLPEEYISKIGFAGLDVWLGFVQNHYGYPFVRLEARQGNAVSGFLSMTMVHHPIFGRFLTTAPYASYGGFVFSSQETRDALLTEAASLCQDADAEYAVVRFAAGNSNPPMGWQQHPVYATYLVELASNPDLLMPAFSSNHRNHIRKSQKRGFSTKFGHLDLLDDAYEAIARSMHELGSPYHHKDYLRRMADALGKKLEFAVVYDSNGELAGGGVFILHGDRVSNLHANILRAHRSDYAGEFLYWSAVQRYCEAGLRTFDLGRSLIGSGNEYFKMKWSPRRQMLAYWYALPPDKPLPAINQKNPKFQLAIAVWKKLPRAVVRLFGPTLIRGLA
ncbi:MAG: hypothetical protein Kow002_18260 [Anaerolineales bacterium]